VERTGLPIPASDIEIFNWAKTNDFILLLTRDEDFIQIVEQKGFPPKIIMLRIANRSSDIVAALLEKHQVAILEFTQDEEQGIL